MDTNLNPPQKILHQDDLLHFLDDIHIGTYLFDSTGNTILANHHFLNMLGYTIEEIRSKSLFDLFDEKHVHLLENGTTLTNLNEHIIKAINKDHSTVDLCLLSKKIQDHAITLVTFIELDQAKMNRYSSLPMTISDIMDINYSIDQLLTISITNQTGEIIYVNNKFCDTSKYTRKELLGKNHRILKSGFHNEEFYQNLWLTISEGKIWKGEFCNRAKDGSIWWADATIIPLMDENNKPYRYIGYRQDVTEQKAVDEILKRQNEEISSNERRFRSLIKNSNEIILILNQQGMIKYISPNIREISDHYELEILGNSVYQYLDSESTPQFKSIFDRALKHYGLTVKSEIPIRDKQGDMRHFSVYLTNLLHDEAVSGVAVNLRDITERKKTEQKIYKMAYFDFLTQLPNRRLFEVQLEQIFRKSEKDKDDFSLMIIDVHGLKFVNDSLNTEIGDLLLQNASTRFNQLADGVGTLYRIDGNELAIILPKFSKQRLKQLAHNMIQLVNHPFSINEYELFLTVNIGACMYPEGGQTTQSLLRNAYTAMRESKTSGRNEYQFFSRKTSSGSYRKFILKNDIRKAIKEQEFFLHFQPRVNPKNHEIIGAEALIRWDHPEFGIVSPFEFIPLAEEEGVIGQIGEWVLNSACMQNKQWQDLGFSPILVSVNFSVIQFLQSDMIQTVERILTTNGLSPDHLEIEITETSMMKDESIVLKKIEQLREMGVKTAIDDFGTGFASLSYLKKLKTNTLKIDKSFIDGIPLESVSSEIVSSIIQLAKKLNIRTVAEGVETIEQLQLLNDICCDEIQGYLFSRPVAVKEFEFLLKEGVCRPE